MIFPQTMMILRAMLCVGLLYPVWAMRDHEIRSSKLVGLT